MRFILVVLTCLSAAACNPYTADLSFARAPGLGYRNAGLFSAGRLYLFDQSSGRLTKLADDIPLEKKAGDSTPAMLSSSSVRGIALNGDFGSAEAKASVRLSLGSKIAFSAERATREEYGSIYTGLSKAYSAGIAQGQDMRAQWYVSDAVKKDSGLYYVVISEIVRADKTTLSVGGIDGGNVADVSISVPGKPGAIKVSLTDSKLVECSGQSAPCFFEVSVVKPYLDDEKKLAFLPARNADLDLLSDAFRNL